VFLLGAAGCCPSGLQRR